MFNYELVHGSDQYNTQMLYFTTPSLSDDEKYLYFLSDMTGKRNIFAKNLINGEIKQLTDDKNNFPESGYAQFGGRRGLGPCASDSKNNIIYYIYDQNLYSVDMEGNTKFITSLPKEEFFSLPHISHDGKYICMSSYHENIVENRDNIPPLSIDRRIQVNNYFSYLNVYETETGKQTLREKVQNGWVTHIQFSPVSNDLILYNHEHTCYDCGIRRVWLFDGKNHIQIRTEGEGRSRHDWTCHEFWSDDGKYILYHGRYIEIDAYVGRYELATGKIQEIRLNPKYGHMYGHFTINNEGLLVSDGYYGDLLVAEKDRPAGSPMYDSAYLTIQKPNWEDGRMEITPLFKHNSSWKTQDEHPHPIFNKKGDTVYFTSDMDGKRKVYRCKFK